MDAPRRIKPGMLLDLAVQLHRDEALAWTTLSERDRRIGKAMQGIQGKARRVAAWLSAVPDAPRRGARALAVIGLVAVAVGLLLGFGAALAVFFYDGDRPVNVLRVIGVFVALQWLTLVLFAIAALPGSGGLPEALQDVSPGRWVAGLVSRMPWLQGETREALSHLLGRGGAHQMVYGRVQKWQVLAWSQALALAFNIAALAAALQLIVGTDLAFGWSTTLQLEDQTVHALTDALSTPWAWAWAEARPGLELIQDTRVYRNEVFTPTASAEEYTQWWPFLVMCMGVYGLLPRVVTWGLARWRLGLAAERAAAWTPGVDRVLDRLDAAVVRTQAEDAEVSSEAGGEVDQVIQPATVAGRVICWAGVDGPGDALPAGGDQTLDQDLQTARSAASGGDAVGAIRVRVKAWEPPVLELLDFLSDLREAAGAGRLIEVQPIGEGDRSVWRKKIAAAGDPWLRLVGEDAS